MSQRKNIPADIQKQVLLKSRRRCCLCFWLDGVDEVVKGQIAHLDQDSSNNKVENLAFLCFDHHDEYDGRPNVSKGFQRQEVAQWRDELYKEMEYRFRSVRSRKVQLTVYRFDAVDPGVTFRLDLRLKNVGEATIKNATLSIRLPENVTAESPPKPPVRHSMPHPLGGEYEIPMPSVDLPEMFGFDESTENFFEPSGRVGIYSMHPMNRGLLPDHSLEISGLGFRNEDYPDGAELTLEFRVDADEMDPQMGKLQLIVPTELEWLLQDPERYGLSKDITLEELEQQVNTADDS